MKLTEAQKTLLVILASADKGSIFHFDNNKRVVNSLMHRIPALISDVYEMPGGGLSASITEAGREALAQDGDGK